MKSIAKCNKCGFVSHYSLSPSRIKCKSCGSNESLSVREGPDVRAWYFRVGLTLGSVGMFNRWCEVA